MPPNVSITGNVGPNDLRHPTKRPDWHEQTLFLATRGSTEYDKNYCHAKDMVTTRVGFVLSSFVTVRNVSCAPPSEADTNQSVQYYQHIVTLVGHVACRRSRCGHDQA